MIFGMWAAHAASLTFAPRNVAPFGIDLKNKFGDLTVTNTQTMASMPKMDPNGTILFDLRGYERQQVQYSYLVKSYGNGTFNLRFLVSQTPQITALLSLSSAYVNGVGWVEVNYSANVLSDPLILTFIGTASQQISNGIVNGSGMYPLLMTVSGIFMVITMVDLFVSPLQGRKPFLRPKLAVSILIMSTVSFLIMLLITAQFVGVLKGAGT